MHSLCSLSAASIGSKSLLFSISQKPGGNRTKAVPKAVCGPFSLVTWDALSTLGPYSHWLWFSRSEMGQKRILTKKLNHEIVVELKDLTLVICQMNPQLYLSALTLKTVIIPIFFRIMKNEIRLYLKHLVWFASYNSTQLF